jgi:hypothetical protein
MSRVRGKIHIIVGRALRHVYASYYEYQTAVVRPDRSVLESYIVTLLALRGRG